MAEKKEKKPVVLRAKKKMGAKTKTGKKECQVKKARHRNWNSVTVDDPDIQHMLLKIGRPRKIKDANELLSQFNEYLASCIEKTRKAKLIPVKTEQVGVDNENEEILDEIEEVIEKKWKGGKNKVTNNVISQFEIVDGQEWSKTPTIGWFLLFLGGLCYDTWTEYRNREEFTEATKIIDNTLEEIRIDQAAKGNINPSIAQLVLNFRYNRIPKKEIDGNIKGSVFNESDFIKD